MFLFAVSLRILLKKLHEKKFKIGLCRVIQNSVQNTLVKEYLPSWKFFELYFTKFFIVSLMVVPRVSWCVFLGKIVQAKFDHRVMYLHSS